MSKMYAGRAVSPPRGRLVSPTNKATALTVSTATNNTSPSKKRPFISTTKSSASFGEPPPLPPRPPSPEKQLELSQSASSHVQSSQPPTYASTPAEPDTLSPSYAQTLQKQTCRWLNLSSTFWALIVMDAQRSVDKEGLENFFDVMDWRAHGKITEQEFTALFAEWIGKSASLTGSSSSRRKHTVGVFSVRQLLLERRCVESDLDLLIGMIIHETNRVILNSPIAFSGRESKANTANLEVCSRRWMSLSEELFFSLDTPGYGFLRFDEFFFLAACMTVGLQGWHTENEVEADFSVGSLTAIALQMMREAGAAIIITSNRKELLAMNLGASQKGMMALQQDRSDIIDSCSISVGQSTNGAPEGKESLVSGLGGAKLNSIPASSLAVGLEARVPAGNSTLNHKLGLGGKHSYPQYGKYSVTLPMFKAYLIKRGIGESALSALAVHVQSCVDRLARITNEGAAELYASLKPIENKSSLGSCRLWQQAVLTAAGFDCDSGRLSTPPLILFLLSDAEKLIPGSLRASESGVTVAALSYNGGHDISPSLNPDTGNNYRAPNRVSRLNPVDELHETAHQLWQAFRNWGSSRASVSSSGNNSSRGSYNNSNLLSHLPARGGGSQGTEDAQKDPAYQLILSSLVEYKILQHQLCAAFFDLAMAYYGLGGPSVSANAVSLLCARLMPNPESMIIELGLDEGVLAEQEFFQQSQQTAQSRYGSILNIQNSGIPSVQNRFGDSFTAATSAPLTTSPSAISSVLAASPYVRALKISSNAPKENSVEEADISAPVGTFVIEKGTGVIKPEPDLGGSSPSTATVHRSSANWKVVFDARAESYHSGMRSPGRSGSVSNFIIHGADREQGWLGSPSNSGSDVAASPTNNNSVLESLLLERLLSTTDPAAQLGLVEQLKLLRQTNSDSGVLRVNNQMTGQTMINSSGSSGKTTAFLPAAPGTVVPKERRRSQSPTSRIPVIGMSTE
jgi:hypothetical protein